MSQLKLSGSRQSATTSHADHLRAGLHHSVSALAEKLADAPRTATSLVTADLPETLLKALAEGGSRSLRTRASVSWEQPSRAVSLYGLGEAVRLRGERTSTLADAMAALRGAAARAVNVGKAPDARPRFFGGARFDPNGDTVDPAWDSFGGWQFVAPIFLIAIVNGRASGTCTLLLEPGETAAGVEARLAQAIQQALQSHPSMAVVERRATPGPALDDEEWKSRVATALAEIEAGRYEKVVLARRSRIERVAPDEIGGVLGTLASRYGNCYVFKFRTPQADWIGASPELLVSLSGGNVRTASLAGSRPRSGDSDEDHRRGAELLADPKERAEHEYVALALREALAPLCVGLHSPPAPEVMTLTNILHLYTPFEGRVRPGADVLDLVASVHPTPAVGGWPRAESIAAINRLEQIDRGWYSGPIGWMDFAGDGEFAVALRIGLVSPTEALLFAGAGIVEGSFPASELAETETKFRPLREALGGG